MAKQEQNANQNQKDTHVYLPIGARAVVYPYEMVDNALVYVLLSGVFLALVCLTVGLSSTNKVANLIVYWSAVGLEVLIIAFMIVYHKRWYRSLRMSDEFTLLYDTTSGEVVCYLNTAREKRIMAKDIVEVDNGPDLLFRPFSRMLNLLTHEMGHVTLTYLNGSRRKKLVIRDFSKPSLAASRLEVLLKKLKANEDPTKE